MSKDNLPVLSRAMTAVQIFCLYTAVSISCSLMLNIITGYASFKNDVQFLLFKQEYIENKVWKIAFYTHVFSAIISLFAGFTQFSAHFLKAYRKWHRIIGQIYVWNILIINFPCGMILAIYANGGLYGKMAFILLDILWCWFTFMAFINVKAKNFTTHKYNMMRSYALTLSAITLRSWHIILISTLSINYNKLYIMEAWLGFIPNLIVAEIIIMMQKKYHKHNLICEIEDQK